MWNWKKKNCFRWRSPNEFRTVARYYERSECKKEYKKREKSDEPNLDKIPKKCGHQGEDLEFVVVLFVVPLPWIWGRSITITKRKKETIKVLMFECVFFEWKADAKWLDCCDVLCFCYSCLYGVFSWIGRFLSLLEYFHSCTLCSLDYSSFLGGWNRHSSWTFFMSGFSLSLSFTPAMLTKQEVVNYWK